MSKALAIPVSSDENDWTVEEQAMMMFVGITKMQGNEPVTAPRSVVSAFLSTCARVNLDPVAKQIYCVEVSGKWLIMVSIDGLRLIAQRSHEYQGQTAPEWTNGKRWDEPLMVSGVLQTDPEGRPVMVKRGPEWMDIWLEEGNPAAARVGVWREGFREPTMGIALWSAYGKAKVEAAKHNYWKVDGAHMLAKCAEANALRKAFPMETSGLYIPEEIELGEVESVTSTKVWEDKIAAENDVEGLKLIWADLRASGEWTKNLGAKLSVRRAVLERDAEKQDAEKQDA